jgi:hypothetical protein
LNNTPPPNSDNVIEKTIAFKLHKKQLLAFKCPAREILYGGSAGGGKSHLARVMAIIYCFAVPGLNVYIFRKNWDDLKKNHVEGESGFRNLLQPFIESGNVELIEKEIRFRNSSRIFLCHAQYDKDVYGYQGAELHFLILEEATQFSEFSIRYLRSRVRMPNTLKVKVPDWLMGQFPRILYTSNPGGPSHTMFRDMFVNTLPKYTGDKSQIVKAPDSEGGFTRAYIPAWLSDNPSLDQAEYTATLAGLKDPIMVRAYLEGDWNIHSGSFFSCFGDKHILEPRPIPKHWTKYLGFDWGYLSPFCAVWGGISSGRDDNGNEVPIPKGAIVIYREYSDTKVSNPDIGRRIRELSANEQILISEADPSIFNEQGGPSIAEQMEDNGAGWHFQRADNDRVSGWMDIRRKLLAEPLPLLYIFSSCGYLASSFGAAQVSPKNPEDLDTDGDDHALDALRYLVKARAKTSEYKETIEPVRHGRIIVNEYVKETKREKGRVAI